ncbi:MAG: TRAP transporter small permease [Alphaproteobacteria bacterium]
MGSVTPAGAGFRWGRRLRITLDRLYGLCAAIAAVCLVAILVIILAQMLARWSGLTFPGATSYAGYCMAAASFFAFASALNHGAHIRVSLLLQAAGRYRRWLELWCFAVASALMWYFVVHATRSTLWSWRFGDVSQGQDATPLWIPQSAMVIGGTVFAIALTDHLVRVIRTGASGIRREVAGDGTG